MPLALLGAYAQAIPTVEAAERIAAIGDARVGSQPIKRSAARDHIRGLERAAQAHQRPRPASPARLRAAGIGVEFHTRAGGEPWPNPSAPASST